MDVNGLIHGMLNMTLLPLVFFALVVLVPPFYLFKFFYSLFIKPCNRYESVAGKVVLITGASSGIGEALAYEYARRGASLALVARREDRLHAVVNKALQLGAPDAIFFVVHVSNIQDSQRFIEDTINHYGQLDHLVNNAGTNQAKLFEKYSSNFSDLAPIMDINFWGSVYATHLAIPHLRKSRGKIVVISSTAAWYPAPKLSFYQASKAAMTMFFETLRVELGADIGITIVAPGIIQSEMSHKILSPSQVQTNISIPVESTERCAKAIIKSACRGDLYLIEPSWARIGLWVKWFLPIVVDWFCLKIVKMPPHTSKKDI